MALPVPQPTRGFDRRKRSLVLGTLRDHPSMLIVLLVVLNILSLIDGTLTAFELATGIAREGNPAFGLLISANPLFAGALKVALMAAISVIIWRNRRIRTIIVLAPLALMGYVALLAYHLGSLNGYGWI